MSRMPRADRRRWGDAATVADLGQLVALWLEGRIASQPGYEPRCGPDEETRPLVPTLAALCRAGMVTTGSQPGVSRRGRDGAWWEQRAWVEGHVEGGALLDRVARAARRADSDVLIDSKHPVIVTTRDGRTHTLGGGDLPRSYWAQCWADAGPAAVDALRRAHRVTVVARRYGPAGDRLWPALASAAR